MKQKIYIIALVNVLLIFTGAIFKINHWPAAGIMLSSGLLFLVFATVPLTLVSHYRSLDEKPSPLLHIITWLTCFVVFTGMLFKIMHWPYAGLALTIAIPFPYVVFLPVYITVTSRKSNFNIYNTVFVLLLLALNAVLAALLSLNVSKQRILDSYQLSRNYVKTELILEAVPSKTDQSDVSMKIDAAIKTVEEYRSLIFAEEGITSVEWKNNPQSLIRPDSRQVALKALFSAKNPVETRLEKELKELVVLMQNTPGYEAIAKAAPDLFDIRFGEGGDTGWTMRNFINPTLSWSLIYLDRVKASLLIMKSAYM